MINYEYPPLGGGGGIETGGVVRFRSLIKLRCVLRDTRGAATRRGGLSTVFVANELRKRDRQRLLLLWESSMRES